MIRLNKVTKHYADLTVVNQLDLAVESGSISGIIGRSGAGKSTILRLMNLLEKPDAGEIYFNGRRVDVLSGQELLQEQRKMGMIFQNFNLFSSRNVEDNISYPLEIAGLPKRQIKERVGELLDLVQISDKRTARLRELSGGQKQRVAIARALAANPQVLFCDEATSALDPQTTRSILTLIKSLQERLKLTVILVTHQMEVVRSICSRVAVLDGGRIAVTGSVDAVFASPSVKEFFHAE
ncbi:Methionine transport system ATP-binding protein [Candidatus Termititenax spirochaetophilus]|uniref:Methionine transport system ATP-binding protein n=1 Tax=Candidatus Termititenax spirochaetophilus TaxID=2218522 RepID=A0A388T721_9BACT|nr:Methionine transport system ATP-binding protein [Candidatus Termititenax spirochaetophilus]